MKETTKISIVTVTYNCKDTVEKTIQNVLKQTYQNIEYIVIDGNSTDGTKEIIERYADRLAYWVSEPDKGIYDAMNKGIKAATGDWILFRNSGDYFFEPSTVEKVFDWYKKKNDEVKIITGGERCYGSDGYFDYLYNYKGNDVWEKARFPHPSTFIDLEIQKKNLYPTDLRISSDFYLFQKLMLEEVSFAIYPGNVSLFDCETGVSSCNKGKGWQERIITLQRLGAPENVVRRMVYKRYYTIFASKVISLLSKWKFTRGIYTKHNFPNWVKQSVDKTLSEI